MPTAPLRVEQLPVAAHAPDHVLAAIPDLLEVRATMNQVVIDLANTHTAQDFYRDFMLAYRRTYPSRTVSVEPRLSAASPKLTVARYYAALLEASHWLGLKAIETDERLAGIYQIASATAWWSRQTAFRPIR